MNSDKCAVPFMLHDGLEKSRASADKTTAKTMHKSDEKKPRKAQCCV